MKQWDYLKEEIHDLISAHVREGFTPLAKRAMESINANSIEISSSMGIDFVRVDDKDILPYAGFCQYDPRDPWPDSEEMEELVGELIDFYDQIGCNFQYSIEIVVNK